MKHFLTKIGAMTISHELYVYKKRYSQKFVGWHTVPCTQVEYITIMFTCYLFLSTFNIFMSPCNIRRSTCGTTMLTNDLTFILSPLRNRIFGKPRLESLNNNRTRLFLVRSFWERESREDETTFLAIINSEDIKYHNIFLQYCRYGVKIQLSINHNFVRGWHECPITDCNIFKTPNHFFEQHTTQQT